MKKIILLFVAFSSLANAQMPNISKIWLNGGKTYTGTIGNKKEIAPLLLNITVSEQNRKNDQEYLVAGNTSVEHQNSDFEGKITITKYKDRKKSGTVFGEYELAEKPGGTHTGIFKGKFVYTFKWNPKTEKIGVQQLSFSGDWKSYDGRLNYKTTWKNQ